MTGCPHPTQRRSGVCQMCAVEQKFDGVDLNKGDYECPECGGETSGRDVVCYKCRGGSE
ncbi:hypothetical protein [Halorubrum distributum]|uniref:hypothetical protein n=1 Tax=Halorubrum distributum TaxID=29283 RepID=UPI001375DA30|nr:hypothetical protein [Halorubrum arcis]